MSCPVCVVGEPARTYCAHEMLLGTRDPFTYAECLGCGSLWLIDPPGDMGCYYPPAYIPFAETRYVDSGLRLFAKKAMTDLVAKGVIRRRRHWTYALYLAGARKRDRILDVGSGSGAFLTMLHQRGYTRATGVDPFAEPGPFTHKGTIEDVRGKFDLIFFNDSLEHVPNPRTTLSCASRRLTDEGRIIVKVPVADSHAWRVYGTNWFQLDAPRHFTVPTRNGIGIMAKASGLAIAKVVDDSTAMQFWASELYRQNIAFTENHGFGQERIEAWERESEILNRRHKGDHAIFVLTSGA